MSERGPIICATDLSPSGSEAVEIAARMAAATGRALRLLHVGAPAPELDRDPVSEPERVYRERLRRRHEAAEAALEKERLRAAALGPPTTATLLSGRPWERLVQTAADEEASLIVVGPHGHRGPKSAARRGLSEWILGSTADRILRHAPCPVLVGPRGDEHGHPIGGGTWLVAVDFSAPSREALKLAKGLAGACQAQLVALHVSDDPILRLDPAGDAEPFPPLDAVAEEMAVHKRAQLVGFVKSTIGEALEVHVATGEPAYEIAARAEQIDARLVIMGTHGRKGLAHFFLGSTAERTLRASGVPILCVRS